MSEEIVYMFDAYRKRVFLIALKDIPRKNWFQK